MWYQFNSKTQMTEKRDNKLKSRKIFKYAKSRTEIYL